jgi:CheY-like chemotaxis protein
MPASPFSKIFPATYHDDRRDSFMNMTQRRWLGPLKHKWFSLFLRGNDKAEAVLAAPHEPLSSAGASTPHPASCCLVKKLPETGLTAADVPDGLKDQGDKLKILLIEDESIYFTWLTTSIGALDQFADCCQVVLAQDAPEALSIFRSYQPHLIICDIDLGSHQLTGIDLVRSFRRDGADALICVHSNRATHDAYKVSMDAGSHMFVPKPMSPQLLEDLLTKALKRRGGLENEAALAPSSPPKDMNQSGYRTGI